MLNRYGSPYDVTEVSTLDLVTQWLFGHEYIAVDCEFTNQELSIIQVAGRDKAAFLIKVRAPGLQGPSALNSLKLLFEFVGVVKVFHDPSQDLKRLNDEFTSRGTQKFRVESIFDTQIAAQINGLGKQLAYRTLLYGLSEGRILLDKSARLTNWSAPVLTEQQRQYAANDVTYLFDEVVPSLYMRLRESGQFDLFVSAMNNVSRGKRANFGLSLPYERDESGKWQGDRNFDVRKLGGSLKRPRSTL